MFRCRNKHEIWELFVSVKTTSCRSRSSSNVHWCQHMLIEQQRKSLCPRQPPHQLLLFPRWQCPFFSYPASRFFCTPQQTALAFKETPTQGQTLCLHKTAHWVRTHIIQWGKKEEKKKVNVRTDSVSLLHKQLETSPHTIINHAKMLIQICIMSSLHYMSTQILYMRTLHLRSCCPPTQLSQHGLK